MDNTRKGFKLTPTDKDKRIAELEADYKTLLTSYNILKDNDKKIIKEMGEQIEKMKCCSNCKHSRTEYEHCRTDKHEKWEIKE